MQYAKTNIVMLESVLRTEYANRNESTWHRTAKACHVSLHSTTILIGHVFLCFLDIYQSNSSNILAFYIEVLAY